MTRVPLDGDFAGHFANTRIGAPLSFTRKPEVSARSFDMSGLTSGSWAASGPTTRFTRTNSSVLLFIIDLFRPCSNATAIPSNLFAILDLYSSVKQGDAGIA